MKALHNIENRNLLDECPPEIDASEWALFRRDYHRAEDFENQPFPVQIDVELNGGCNMKCPFCWHGYETRPRQSFYDTGLTLERFKRLIDEARMFGIRALKLNYINEPMMRLDLEDCIVYAKRRGMLNIFFATNGTMLTAKRALRLIRSGVTKLFISIDAATSETYDKQRLSGRFNRVVRNILLFISLRNRLGLRYPLVRVSFLRNQLNAHEEQDFLSFWSERADMVGFQTMSEVPDETTGLCKPNGATVSGCTYPFKQLVIDYEGDILPCCKMGGKELRLGNIEDMTLKEAWNSIAMKRLQKLHKDGRWHENEVCRRCIGSMT